jgi:membrane-associated HD superfamily phosphohydrolase
MAEPNPGRIENLVRRISQKRLTDGQFDQCDLTFRELHAIEDAAITRLCAIHHGRITYPTATEPEDESGIDDTGAEPITRTA